MTKDRDQEGLKTSVGDRHGSGGDRGVCGCVAGQRCLHSHALVQLYTCSFKVTLKRILMAAASMTQGTYLCFHGIWELSASWGIGHLFES